MAELCDLGATVLDDNTNLVGIQATVQITSEEGDIESYGEVADYSCLGVTSRPYPKTDRAAKGVVFKEVGNKTGAILGARDPRCTAVYGNLGPGDTALHACSPNAASQVICYGSDAQGNKVAMLTKDSSDNTTAIVIDGKNDKIQITGFGSMFEMNNDGIVMSTGQASISINKDGSIMILGKVQLGGLTPTHSLIAAETAAVTALSALAGGGVVGAGNVTVSGLTP
tara:strand:+ start:3807 stop:4484 length:678 start_codon:yes stop_codon:yes gene_type:complete